MTTTDLTTDVTEELRSLITRYANERILTEMFVYGMRSRFPLNSAIGKASHNWYATARTNASVQLAMQIMNSESPDDGPTRAGIQLMYQLPGNRWEVLSKVARAVVDAAALQLAQSFDITAFQGDLPISHGHQLWSEEVNQRNDLGLTIRGQLATDDAALHAKLSSYGFQRIAVSALKALLRSLRINTVVRGGYEHDWYEQPYTDVAWHVEKQARQQIFAPDPLLRATQELAAKLRHTPEHWTTAAKLVTERAALHNVGAERALGNLMSHRGFDAALSQWMDELVGGPSTRGTFTHIYTSLNGDPGCDEDLLPRMTNWLVRANELVDRSARTTEISIF